MIGRTLQPLYSNKDSSELLYILYNDQAPNRSSTSPNGHSKGVILAGASGGIWLQHSVPKFRDLNANYDYASSGENNAPLSFCTSLSGRNIDSVIAQALLHIKPTIYSHSVPLDMKEVYPSIAKLTSRERKNVEPSKVFSLIEGDLNIN